jgi:hypothetical protein
MAGYMKGDEISLNSAVILLRILRNGVKLQAILSIETNRKKPLTICAGMGEYLREGAEPASSRDGFICPSPSFVRKQVHDRHDIVPGIGDTGSRFDYDHPAGYD